MILQNIIYYIYTDPFKIKLKFGVTIINDSFIII